MSLSNLRPLVSILVPTHNRCDMLKETLASVFQQSEGLEYIELIISNDASSDGTRDYLNTLKKSTNAFPISIFHHDKNLGGPGNWKFLLEQAKGEFVYLLSDDDHIKSDFLKVYKNIIDRHPDVDIIYSGIEYCDEAMQPLCQSQISSVPGLVGGIDRLKNQLIANHMVMSSIYRRNIFLKAGGWEAKYGTCLDGAAFAKMCTQSRNTFFVEETLFCYRLGSQTWSSFKPEKQKKQYQSFRLIIEDIESWATRSDVGNLAFYKSCYAAHAQGVLNMLDLKMVHGEIAARDLKNLLADLQAVFPEATSLFSYYKMQIVSYLGVRWLERLRVCFGKGIRGKSVFEKGFVPQGEKP